ncbi:MAG: hypothetical protein K8S54_10390 [Spirochaetia bacterium]|nr:hypothetical protein [Spirochaetia bacterium]
MKTQRQTLITLLIVSCFAPLLSEPQLPLMFQPSARTPRNAALKTFIVGGSWECTAVLFSPVYTFKNDDRVWLETVGETWTYEIREAQILIRMAPDKPPRVLAVLDAQKSPVATMRVQSDLFELQCKRVSERPQKPKAESEKIKSWDDLEKDRARAAAATAARMKHLLQISDITADESGCISFKAKNLSDKMMTRIEMHATYFDQSDRAFAESTGLVAFSKDGEYGPLKPNYSRTDSVCPERNVDMKEWKQGAFKLEIQGIEIADR